MLFCLAESLDGGVVHFCGLFPRRYLHQQQSDDQARETIEKIFSELFSFRLAMMPEMPERIVVGPQSIENLQNILVWGERVRVARQRCPVFPNLSR